MSDLERRVARLEREARRWRLAAAVAAVGCVLGFAVQGQTARETKGTTVKAPFMVIDDSGKPLADIRLGHDGRPMLRVLDPESRRGVVTLLAAKEGGRALVTTKTAANSVHIQASPANASIAAAVGEAVVARMGITQGEGAFSVHGKDGKVVSSIP